MYGTVAHMRAKAGMEAQLDTLKVEFAAPVVTRGWWGSTCSAAMRTPRGTGWRWPTPAKTPTSRTRRAPSSTPATSGGAPGWRPTPSNTTGMSCFRPKHWRVWASG
jgi:hypothetical protein